MTRSARTSFLAWLVALSFACAGPVQTSGPGPSAADVGQDAAPGPGDATAADASLADSAQADSAPGDSVAPDAAADSSAVADVAVIADVGSPPDAEAGKDTAQPDAVQPPTTVWVHHPFAAEMALRGDTPPLSWDADLAPIEVLGDAARFVLPDKPGTIQIKAMRKGLWALGNNHVVQLHEQRHVYPYFDAKGASGRRENYELAGPSGTKRTLRTFLPPGYDENTLAKYPLLLMMDGQNLFEDETASFGVSWQLDEAVLKAMAAAQLGEIVVIGMDHAGAKRIYEYTPWLDKGQEDGGGGELFLQWVDKVVLPDSQKRYRLLDDRLQRAIGGSSLGALMSLYALETRPQTWGSAVCMSGAWWWDDLHIVSWVKQLWSPLPVRVWLDAGTEKDGLKDTQLMQTTLTQLGLKEPATLGFYIDQGANHSEQFWAKRVHLALEFLFNPGNLKAPF